MTRRSNGRESDVPSVWTSCYWRATPSTSQRPTITPRRWAPDLKKQFLAFERLIDSAELAGIKRADQRLGSRIRALGRHPEPRPLNLDPGTSRRPSWCSLRRRIMRTASTCDDGIYAEVTLVYRQRKWQPLEWTYPDYRRDDYQRFFTQCREWRVELRQSRRRGKMRRTARCSRFRKAVAKTIGIPCESFSTIVFAVIVGGVGGRGGRVRGGPQSDPDAGDELPGEQGCDCRNDGENGAHVVVDEPHYDFGIDAARHVEVARVRDYAIRAKRR